MTDPAGPRRRNLVLAGAAAVAVPAVAKAQTAMPAPSSGAVAPPILDTRARSLPARLDPSLPDRLAQAAGRARRSERPGTAEAALGQPTDARLHLLWGGEPQEIGRNDLIAQWQAMRLGFDAAMRELGPVSVFIDANRATADAPVTGAHLLAGDAWILRGRYHARLERSGATWIISALTYEDEDQQADVLSRKCEKPWGGKLISWKVARLEGRSDASHRSALISSRPDPALETFEASFSE